jgi:hypothetical protein
VNPCLATTHLVTAIDTCRQRAVVVPTSPVCAPFG